MPTSTDRRSHTVQRCQPDRSPQSAGGPREEPRDFETQVSEDDRNYDAPIGPDLEPIEDPLEPIEDADDIDTHGSER
jgi:hypothetical protein